MDAAAETRWISLVISLPGRRGTARMRVWRALRALGAGVLRDGVYLLPDSRAAREAFAAQAGAIRQAGGSAQVLPLDGVTREQGEAFRALFDRGAEYADLVARLHRLRTGPARKRPESAARTVRGLRREFDALRATDHFPGAPARQAEELITELEAQVSAAAMPGEPSAAPGLIERRDSREYRGRRWATRARPWVDRLASAWLIKRFIDPQAKFLWLQDIRRRPKSTLGFDFDGAEFSHAGSRVTFETLLASFGLESDAALVRIGRLVHCLDVGGAPVAEAQGLAAILAGARQRIANDDALLAEANRIFDSLYVVFQQE
jgi:hypothetical protein